MLILFSLDMLRYYKTLDKLEVSIDELKIILLGVKK